MNKNKTYILASGSPRRIEIMRSHGIDPIIHPASIEENIPPENGMCQTVMFLALKKAKAVETEVLDKAVFREGDASVEGDSPIIIAGDTIVYKDEIMGKPENREDAYRMLAKLKNDYHYVVTGCALVEAGIQRQSFCGNHQGLRKGFNRSGIKCLSRYERALRQSRCIRNSRHFFQPH